MDELAQYLPGLLLAFSVFLIGFISPGPNILAVLGTSMSVGRRAGVSLALGIGTGSVCWASLTVAGLSALLSVYAQALIAIKIVGGLYLLWLACKALRAATTPDPADGPPTSMRHRSALGHYASGLTIQMTNPKAALTWITIVSLGLHPGAPIWVGLVLVIGMGLKSILVHVGYALAFSTDVMARIYARARRWIQGLLAMVFGYAGYRLLTSRL